MLEGQQLRSIPRSPHNSAARRWLAINGGLFGQLRSVEFLGRVLRKLRLGTENWRTPTWDVVEAIFDDLDEEHKLRGSELVLVFLPKLRNRHSRDSFWGRRITDYARRAGVVYIDLVDESRDMGLDEFRSLFIPAGEIDVGHLNKKGNLWVAKHLATRVPSLLSAVGGPNEVP